MELNEFDYLLPEELIAQVPLERRDATRMLVLNRSTGGIRHQKFRELPEFIRAGDVLVFNQTRVLPVRLLGRRNTGGLVECFVVEVTQTQQAKCLLRASSRKDALTFEFSGGESARVMGRDPNQENLFIVQFALRPGRDLRNLMAEEGHIPLPPYIRREDNLADRERYQTVYAKEEGSLAAPTAGLHFTDAVLAALKAKGAELNFLTLHVGLGTFLPVKTKNIEDHKMHAEYLHVSEDTAKNLVRAKAEGRRVIAIGTTSVRALETYARAARMGEAWAGSSELFLRPGSEFKIVDGIFTNFHQPKSTLLMLMSAFAGLENLRAAYQSAIQEKYRFLSYGDCMVVF